MAKELPAEGLPTGVENMMQEFGVQTAKPVASDEPVYRILGDSKVVVSKSTGKMWQKRKDTSAKTMKDIMDAWDEAISYFLNTPDNNRNGEGDGGITAGSRWARDKINNVLTERENIVYANVSAIVPTLYAKAPEITIDTKSEDPAQQEYAELCEELLNKLLNKKSYPGINIKPKVKKGIVATCLTNEAWIEVGYTEKEIASEAALAELDKLSTQFAKAKSPKELKEIEGKIQAMEAKVDVLLPSGPYAKLIRGHQVLIDPETRDDDCMDASWIMYYDFIPTAFLQAQFGQKDDSGNWVMVYEPTHKLNATGDERGLDSTVNNFKLFAENTDQTVVDRREGGLTASDDYTKIWKIYDKTTRRILMFHDKDWSWPIWVWDDTNNLDSFYPLSRLQFHTQPDSVRGKGEVSYYLDQIDGLNEINDAEARARQWIKRNVIYNTNYIKDANEIAKYLKGDSSGAMGMAVPEGVKLDDVMMSPTPDVLKFRALFDDAARASRLSAIDRVSSTNDVLRGAQFKTNTTNKAIDTYSSVQNTRLDERIDAIEEWIGDIAWKLLQLCVPRMPTNDVVAIIGPERGSKWINMPVDAFRTNFVATITGGSTVKPTSKAKKEEAMELGQVLGQFVNAAPGPVLKKMMQVFSRAFDEMVMTDRDWQELDQAIFSAQQQGNSTGQTAGGPPQDGAPQQGGGNMEQILAQLPPEAQQAVQGAIQKGVPPEAAIQEVMKMISQ